jgi:hypothetical protein
MPTEHVNTTAELPTLNEAARFALGLGSRPRLVPTPVEHTANLVLASTNRKRIAYLRSALSKTPWPFVVKTYEHSAASTEFIVTVTL